MIQGRHVLSAQSLNKMLDLYTFFVLSQASQTVIDLSSPVSLQFFFVLVIAGLKMPELLPVALASHADRGGTRDESLREAGKRPHA